MALIQFTFLLCSPLPLGLSLTTLVTFNWSMWKDLFLSTIDSAIPKVKWTPRKIKHWFSSSTVNLMHKKRKLYPSMCQHPTSTNKAQYRTISNLVRIMTRFETKKRATDFSQSSPIKKSWSWVNSESVK